VSPPPAAAHPPRAPSRNGHEVRWAALLLALHAVLALWGATRNSVTFDENFHLPSGVLIARYGELRVSATNPPLVKALCGFAALAAGAKVPDAAALGVGEQAQVGEAFMRANADRFQRVFVAARSVVVALSVLLGALVWRWARRLDGPRAGLFALALYALAPEALAHAGVATLDLATALGFAASVYAFWIFARSGRWNAWLATVLAVGATFLTRFSAVLLAPILIALAIVTVVWGRPRRPHRLWAGLAMLPVTTVAILVIGYQGRMTLRPLSEYPFRSETLQKLQQAAPGLSLPLPDLYLAGFDRQMRESGAGVTPTYLFGRIRRDAPWYYYPAALLVKWPLGFLAALLLRAGLALRSPPSRRRRVADLFLLVPAAVYLAVGMFFARLCIGVRYVLPILPFLCVWCAGLLPRGAKASAAATRRPSRASLAAGLAVLVAVETLSAAPWFLSFFNQAAGGPGGGDRIVNDSNVDWGQGLIALREELARRGITRVHLAYHGTTDPAIYGIDYVPYFGGEPGPESDWLAVSSYFYVGLTQRLMIQSGRTAFTRYDFTPFAAIAPAARPAYCMYLFRLPRRGAR
jgi:hypothetical protein